MTVRCPHCAEKADVALPRSSGVLLKVKCGRCKRYFTVHTDGSVGQ